MEILIKHQMVLRCILVFLNGGVLEFGWNDILQADRRSNVAGHTKFHHRPKDAMDSSAGLCRLGDVPTVRDNLLRRTVL